MQETFITADLWLSATLLSETNATLQNIQISRSGRESVNFIFQGENLSKLAQDYCDEQVVANVIQLRNKINFLRDIIFQSRKN